MKNDKSSWFWKKTVLIQDQVRVARPARQERRSARLPLRPNRSNRAGLTVRFSVIRVMRHYADQIDAPEDTQSRAPGVAPGGVHAVPAAGPAPSGPSSTPITRRRDTTQSRLANPDSNQANSDSDLVDLVDPALSPSSASASFATPARTSQGADVLAMVENAAGFKDAVENLDFQGVMALLGHVDVLRAAAMNNLENRARREREKRAGKAKERERERSLKRE